MGDTHGIEIQYWMIPGESFAAFESAYATEASLFTQIDGNYYLKQYDDRIDHYEFEELLLEWDMEDGQSGGGANTFISDYWTLSTVPNIMWP